MANVRLEGITRRFNGVSIIDEITFEVPDGQFWVLVGPSGCGKSTILRTIAGLETATAGKLYIDNQLVNQVPARQRDVAMVFQNYALYPHMSVAENLAFGLRMRQVDRETIAERVVTVARSLAIDHLLDRKPRQLSGGQQQRVALGRAIAREPKLFLLDEPLSNLDAQLRDDTRAELKQLHQRLGITTLYVTHDQVEAMTLADQMVVLNRGRIQQIGDPSAIYARPAHRMVATFLGNPPMNILGVTYTGDEFQLNHQTIPCPGGIKNQVRLAAGQRFDLGIRPEFMTVVAGSKAINPESNVGYLTVTVSVVEPLGRETLVRGMVAPLGDGAEAIALNIQAPADFRPRPGETITIELNLAHLFIFDSATGDRLYPVP